MPPTMRATLILMAALAMLAAQRGLAFDPRIVDVFLANADTLIALRQRVNQNKPSFNDLVEIDGWGAECV